VPNASRNRSIEHPSTLGETEIAKLRRPIYCLGRVVRILLQAKILAAYMKQIESRTGLLGGIKDSQVVWLDVLPELRFRMPTGLTPVGREEDARCSDIYARPNKVGQAVGDRGESFTNFFRFEFQMLRRFPIAHSVAILEGVEDCGDDRHFPSDCLYDFSKPGQLVLIAPGGQRGGFQLGPLGRFGQSLKVRGRVVVVVHHLEIIEVGRTVEIQMRLGHRVPSSLVLWEVVEEAERHSVNSLASQGGINPLDLVQFGDTGRSGDKSMMRGRRRLAEVISSRGKKMAMSSYRR